ncbi:hypothetical protein SGRIM128S_01908 [Streptomyces griseomycini]
MTPPGPPTTAAVSSPKLEEPDTIGFGIHFADVVFGQVRRDGHGPAWRPLDTRDAGDDR